MSLLPDFTYDCYIRLVKPKPFMIFQEIEAGKGNAKTHPGLGVSNKIRAEA
jgi:hypothetical protein